MTEIIPEYYGDVFYLRTSPWGVAITFGLGPPKDGTAFRDVCTLRLSHETAKALAMILRKQLKDYEKGTAMTICLPTEVVNQLSLSTDDW